MKPITPLICPKHQLPLSLNSASTKYLCAKKCVFPIINHIPRFVPLNNYSTSFGLQWNHYRQTQLDSFTGVSISADRLTRLIGAPPKSLKNKKILEVGCGAGRFTEILLKNGGAVFAVDLSTAVEANYLNCYQASNYFIGQADVVALPVRADSFDVVICVGVIQHTPNSEKTIAALISYLKPGGLLVIDHYSHEYPSTFSRRISRTILTRLPSRFSLTFVKITTGMLWPIHRLTWKMRRVPVFGHRLRKWWAKLSPVVDFHDAYPQLGSKLLRDWAILDTHDTLTDHFKHLRNADQIAKCLKDNKMADIYTAYAGNGVEARAIKKG